MSFTDPELQEIFYQVTGNVNLLPTKLDRLRKFCEAGAAKYKTDAARYHVLRKAIVELEGNGQTEEDVDKAMDELLLTNALLILRVPAEKPLQPTDTVCLSCGKPGHFPEPCAGGSAS